MRLFRISMLLFFGAMSSNLYADGMNKEIRLAAKENESTAQKNRFIPISVKPSKKTYKIKERIHFSINAKKDYYLYVFNVTKKRNTLLFPNVKSKSNFFYANRTYRIPRNVEFYSDKAGEEKILFVATDKLLNLKKHLLTDNLMLSKSLDAINSSDAYDLSDFLTDEPAHITNKGVNKGIPKNVQNRYKALPKLIKVKITQ